MLVTELLELSENFEEDENEDDYQYIRELLKGIAHLPQNDEALERLACEQCWPCRNPNQERQLCMMGDFYINDRQDLFNIFAGHHTFLDFSFEDTKLLTDLLGGQSCSSFLSEKVSVKTECCGKSEVDDDLTEDFRSRADWLVE